MKILRLSFKNLNSLAGEFSLDFTAKEYSQNGIFLITGDTGAGKSTILDAISLAIFGRTPRLSTISKSTNEIMTKGRGFCESCVEFKTLNGSYRATFSQRRSRNKADGALQPPQRELAEIETGKILATKYKEIDNLIEELSGMNYERFTRSILLAQGEFAKFLKSNDSEKASLLEQITGTEIYTDISIMAKKKCDEVKALKKEKQLLFDNIKILSDDEVSIKEALVLENKQKKLELDKLNQKNNQLILWQETILSTNKELEQSHLHEKELLSLKENFKEKEQKLFYGNKAFAILDKEILFNEASKNLQDNKNNIKNIEEHIESLNYELKIQKNKNRALDILNKLSKLNTEALSSLLIFVRDYDSKIESAQKRFDEEELELKKLDKKHQEYQSLYDKELDLYNKITLEIQNKNSFLKESEIYGPFLQKEISALKLKFEDLHSFPKTIGDLKEKISSLSLAKDNLNQQNYQNNLKIKSIKDEAKSLENSLKQEILKQDKLLEGHTLVYFQEKQQEYQNYLNLLATIKSLEEHRQHLENGKHCPLCGATVHPFCKNNDLPKEDETETKLKAVSQKILKLNELDKKISSLKYEIELKKKELYNLEYQNQELEKQQTDKNLEITDLKDKLTNKESKFSDLRNDLKNDFEKHDLKNLDLNDLKILSKLEDKLKKFESLNDDLKKLNDKEKIAYENKATALTNKDNLNKLYIEKKENLNKLSLNLKEIKQNRFELFDNNNAEDKLSEVKNYEHECAQNYAQSLSNINSLQGNIESNLDQKTQLFKKTEELKKDFNNKQTVFYAAIKASGFLDLETFQKAKLSLDELSLLKKESDELISKENRLKGQIDKLSEDLDGLLKENLTSDPLDKLLEKRQNLKEEISLLDNNLGALQKELALDKTNKKEKAQELVLLNKLDKECNRYIKLNDLIGSADGRKFRNFAQGLTFEVMVDFANRQLSKLSDRYVLVRNPLLPLSLNVIDTYEASTIRSTENLSGGECFIISLALALGLSAMTCGKVRVDSLFLDEGFGSLDENSLNVALNCLANLHQDNKLIGIISHVKELQEAISIKIQVKHTNGAHSTIIGPGVLHK